MEDPSIFSFGYFDFTFSLFLSILGGIGAGWILSRTAHEKKLSLKFLSDNILVFFFSALTIGRLGTLFLPFSYVVAEKRLLAEHWYEKFWVYIQSFFSFWHGGIDVVWGLGGFLLVFLIFCAVKNEHPLAWMDSFSLPSLFFLIWYSISNFFSGTNYGRPLSEDSWIAVHYNMIGVKYSGAIHPVQIYEAILFFIIFFIAWKIWGRVIDHKWPNGIFGGITISSMFFTLGFLEFFRWDATTEVSFGFFPTQSLVLFFISLSIFLFMVWRGHFWVFTRFKSIIPTL